MRNIEIDNILNAREERHNKIVKYLDEYQVVTVKANIPGINKINSTSNLIVRYFSSLIKEKFSPIKIINLDSEDGQCNLFLFSKYKCLKEDLVVLEESIIIGRFVDIDCFYKDPISLSRETPRKCFLCDDLAVNCARSKAHSLIDLLNHMDSVSKNFLYDLIDGLINESILEELNLTNKFGLVDKNTSNSHSDMDYKIMDNARKAISPYILSMFKEGFESDLNLKDLFKKIRSIGVKADEAMFKATNNINCYQGLIFNLGIISCLCGRILKTNENFDTIYEYSKVMVEDLDANKGAIGEAKDGYKNINNILNKYSLDTSNYIYALMDLIVNVDDTILEKRCLKNNVDLSLLKTRFKEALQNKDSQLINQLNEYCVENKLSCGGCADLLVVSIFIYRFKRLFNY